MTHDMTAKVYRRAAELIGQGWCRTDFAQDATGRAVEETDPLAVRWCMWGARNRARAEVTGVVSYSRGDVSGLSFIAHIRGVTGTGPMHFNDARARTAAEVADAFRRAAAAVERGDVPPVEGAV